MFTAWIVVNNRDREECGFIWLFYIACLLMPKTLCLLRRRVFLLSILAKEENHELQRKIYPNE